MKVYFYSIMLMLTLTSCSKRMIHKESDKQAQSGKKQAALLAYDLEQARHLDMPIPLGFTLVESHAGASNDYFVYKGNMHLNQLVSFYRQELDRLGWGAESFEHAQETIFVAKKVTKKVVIALQHCESFGYVSSKITIFIKRIRSELSKKYSI